MSSIIKDDVKVTDILVDVAAVAVGIKTFQSGYFGNPVADACLGIAAGVTVKALGKALGCGGAIEI